MMTEKTAYDEKVSKLGTVPVGKARVWVYAHDGSPDLMNTMGRIDIITFNQTPYRMGGNSYMALDLPAGECRVTTVDVLSGFSGKFHPGKSQQNITLQEGKEYFIRVNFKSYRDFADPAFEILDASVALPELKTLKSYFAKSEIEAKLEAN